MPIVTAFSDLKDLIEVTLHLQRDALHVHIGLAFFLCIAAVLKRPGRFRAALVWLLGITLVGEVFDLSNTVSGIYRVNVLNSVKDVVNTMFWPTVLVFAGPLFARIVGVPFGGAGPVGADRHAAGQDGVIDESGAGQQPTGSRAADGR